MHICGWLNSGVLLYNFKSDVPIESIARAFTRFGMYIFL